MNIFCLYSVLIGANGNGKDGIYIGLKVMLKGEFDDPEGGYAIGPPVKRRKEQIN